MNRIKGVSNETSSVCCSTEVSSDQGEEEEIPPVQVIAHRTNCSPHGSQLEGESISAFTLLIHQKLLALQSPVFLACLS